LKEGEGNTEIQEGGSKHISTDSRGAIEMKMGGMGH
jgi:hypothetical protein